MRVRRIAFCVLNSESEQPYVWLTALCCVCRVRFVQFCSPTLFNRLVLTIITDRKLRTHQTLHVKFQVCTYFAALQVVF